MNRCKAKYLRRLLIVTIGVSLVLISNVHDRNRYSQTLINDPSPRSIPLFDENPDNDRVLLQLSYRPRKLREGVVRIYSPNIESCYLHPNKFNRCPVSNCQFDPSPDGADAVLFCNRIPPDYTTQKPPGQIWVFHSREASIRFPTNYSVPHMINWTISYRMDSDIVAPYEKFALRKIPISYNKTKFFKKKKRPVVMFVSNCNQRESQRLRYARELRKFIEVDFYGKCVNNIICREYPRDKCMKRTIEQYWFYLAFENSNCENYITEKFFRNAIGSNVFPVVMGPRKKDYIQVIPPYKIREPFLHVEDFESPKDLAQHLLHLIQNPDEYGRLLEWKSGIISVPSLPNCRLCAFLNDPPMKKSYANFSEWWNAPDTCWKNDYKL